MHALNDMEDGEMFIKVFTCRRKNIYDACIFAHLTQNSSTVAGEMLMPAPESTISEEHTVSPFFSRKNRKLYSFASLKTV